MSVSPFTVTAGLATLYYNKLRWKSLLRTLAVSKSHFTNINKPVNSINRPVFACLGRAAHPQIHLLTGGMENGG